MSDEFEEEADNICTAIWARSKQFESADADIELVAKALRASYAKGMLRAAEIIGEAKLVNWQGYEMLSGPTVIKGLQEAIRAEAALLTKEVSD